MKKGLDLLPMKKGLDLLPRLRKIYRALRAVFPVAAVAIVVNYIFFEAFGGVIVNFAAVPPAVAGEGLGAALGMKSAAIVVLSGVLAIFYAGIFIVLYAYSKKNRVAFLIGAGAFVVGLGVSLTYVFGKSFSAQYDRGLAAAVISVYHVLLIEAAVCGLVCDVVAERIKREADYFSSLPERGDGLSPFPEHEGGEFRSAVCAATSSPAIDDYAPRGLILAFSFSPDGLNVVVPKKEGKVALVVNGKIYAIASLENDKATLAATINGKAFVVEYDDAEDDEDRICRLFVDGKQCD